VLLRLPITRMDEPAKAVVVVDDESIYGRNSAMTSGSGLLYPAMRETLIYLTHINSDDTLLAFQERLAEIRARPAFDKQAVNSLCWACGSIAMTLDEARECAFVRGDDPLAHRAQRLRGLR